MMLGGRVTEVVLSLEAPTMSDIKHVRHSGALVPIPLNAITDRQPNEE